MLLAIVAAGRGHRAFVGDLPGVMRRIFLPRPGSRFVLLKDLEASKASTRQTRIMKAAGCYIGSLDEEAGTLWSSFADFASVRYDRDLVDVADVVFCWGDRDYEFLKLQFPGLRSRFHKTGSPRIDLYAPKFSPVFRPKSTIRQRPFVLVCSSIGVPVGWQLIHQRVLEMRLFNPASSQEWERTRFEVSQYRDDVGVLLAYLDLVRFLSQRSEAYDVVIKPHPIESPSAWEVLVDGFKNVRVSAAPTSELIRNSLAVVSPVSTTAIETVLSGNLYIGFLGSETPARAEDLIGSLGFSAKTPEEVANLLESMASHDSKHSIVSPALPSQLRERFFFDDSSLAAERIIQVMEGVVGAETVRMAPLRNARLSFTDYRYWFSSAFPAVAGLLKKVLGLRRWRRPHRLVKYPDLDRARESQKIATLLEILGLEGKVRHRFVGKRGLVFEPVNRG